MDARLEEYTDNLIARNFGDFHQLERNARAARAQYVGEAVATGLVALGRAVRRAGAWLARQREKQLAVAELQQLDDRLLADLGLNRTDLEAAVTGRLFRGIGPVANVNTAIDADGAANRNTPRYAA